MVTTPIGTLSRSARHSAKVRAVLPEPTVYDAIGENETIAKMYSNLLGRLVAPYQSTAPMEIKIVSPGPPMPTVYPRWEYVPDRRVYRA